MTYKCRFYLPSGTYFDVWLDGNKKLSKNFALYEYANKKSKDEIKAVFYTESWIHIKMIQRMRDMFGAMSGNSWYRTKEYNAKLTNADPRSAHLYGCAFDWYKPKETDYDRKYKADVWKNLCKEYGVVGAINYYTNGYHLEILSDKCYGNTTFKIRDYRGKKGDW